MSKKLFLFESKKFIPNPSAWKSFIIYIEFRSVLSNISLELIFHLRFVSLAESFDGDTMPGAPMHALSVSIL